MRAATKQDAKKGYKPMPKRQTVYFSDEDLARLKEIQRLEKEMSSDRDEPSASNVVSRALKVLIRDQDAKLEIKALENERRFCEKEIQRYRERRDDIDQRIKTAERHLRTQEKLKDLQRANFRDDLEQSLQMLEGVVEQETMERALQVSKYRKVCRPGRGYDPMTSTEIKVALHEYMEGATTDDVIESLGRDQ